MFTTAGHIWLSGYDIPSAVLKGQILRGGSLINYVKSAVVLSMSEYSWHTLKIFRVGALSVHYLADDLSLQLIQVTAD